MNLTDIIAEAQSGQAMANIGRQFGLTEQQSADAVRHLLPAFTAGLERNTATPMGMAELLQALSGGQHARYYDDPAEMENSATRDAGNDILKHLFGNKDVSRAVAQNAAAQTGIGSAILKAMLPYIASIIMGALFKQGQNPIGDILGEILGGGPAQAGRGPGGHGRTSAGSDADDAFKELSDIFKEQIGEPSSGSQPSSGVETAPSPQRQAGNQQVPGANADIFKDIFKSEGDRSPFEDILKDMLGGGRR
jgi:hypothetical protein